MFIDRAQVEVELQVQWAKDSPDRWPTRRGTTGTCRRTWSSTRRSRSAPLPPASRLRTTTRWGEGQCLPPHAPPRFPAR